MKKFASAIMALMLLALFSELHSQQIMTPRVSPAAEVSQTIGFSKISVTYSRPSVQGRPVWGNLVKYGMEPNEFGNKKAMPWRAGANENTTVTFSDDVTINGKPLKAGKYGLHMIPAESGEWTIIFSKDNQAWGSFFYEESNDALRVQASPEKSHFEEWLTYGFDQIKPASARLFMHWENLRIGVTCEFDEPSITLYNITAQLTGAPGFSWQNWNQAALYALQTSRFLDKAEGWIKRSVSINENVNNRNLLGYVLMAENKIDEALKIFKENLEKYPDNWNVYDSYAEALAKSGDVKGAVEYFEKALSMAPDGQKKRIQQTIDDLKK
ncbi:MAG: DUF2911 domain-containing protein [Ignavibacteriaceae bacterium]|nr:DUF2911 domain-containing protein [Ignavibacteriaceae bacterium]